MSTPLCIPATTTGSMGGDFLKEVIRSGKTEGEGVLRRGISTQGAVSARPAGGTGLACLTWGECKVRDLEEAGYGKAGPSEGHRCLLKILAMLVPGAGCGLGVDVYAGKPRDQG